MKTKADAALRPDYDAIVPAPFGAVGLRCGESTVAQIDFLGPRPAQPGRTPLAREAAAQLRAYLKHASAEFDLPLEPRGTAFQQRVWCGIAAIPNGETRSYGQLAAELGSAARAVGQACGANPFPIVIPCHRVVAVAKGFNAGLGGFAHAREGELIDVKRWLLRHEGVGGT